MERPVRTLKDSVKMYLYNVDCGVMNLELIKIWSCARLLC